MIPKYNRGDVVLFQGIIKENEPICRGVVAVIDNYGDNITYDIRTQDKEPILYKHVDESLVLSRVSSILESIADHDLFKYASYVLFKGASKALVSKEVVEDLNLARFSREMNSIILTGYSKELVLMRTIMKEFKDKMILFAGNIGSSYVAFSYLDKRTGLCPCGIYDEKVAFGYKNDKKPSCIMLVPKGLTRAIELLLKKKMGLEYFYHIDGNDICIGAEDEPNPIRFAIYEEELLTAFQKEDPHYMSSLDCDPFGFGKVCNLFDDSYEVVDKGVFDQQVLRWLTVFIDEHKSHIDESILSDRDGFLSLFDGSKDSLCCCIGYILGNGLYYNGTDHRFYSRDGLYDLLKGQIDEHLAYSLMDQVRKGMGNTFDLSKVKLKDDSLYESFKSIKYLSSESECQLYAQLIWALAKTTCHSKMRYRG